MSLLGCSRSAHNDPSSLTFLIESNPTNLDPRYATELRPLEVATLFSDVAKGNFQLTYLRWVGANNDPDFFEFAFSSKRFSPDGANRGHYRNPRMTRSPTRSAPKWIKKKGKPSAVRPRKSWPTIFPTSAVVHRRSLGPSPSSRQPAALAYRRLRLPSHPPCANRRSRNSLICRDI